MSGLVANASATKQKPLAKRTKTANTSGQIKAVSKGPKTNKGDQDDEPAKKHPFVTIIQIFSRADMVMAGVNAGKAKNIETETSDRKYYPAPSSEKRPRNWLEEPSKSFLERSYRSQTEKMFVINHNLDHVGKVPVITFDIAGTTGNLYKTSIGRFPSCDCPDSKFRRGLSQCKHIIYILIHVLKAPEELQFQTSFLPLELSRMLAASPLHKIELASMEESPQKPIEGSCPICFMDFDSTEEVIWCRNGCGNKVHKLCFDKWISANKASGLGVRCVYCRTPWRFSDPGQNLQSLRDMGLRGKNGYVNIGDKLGVRNQNTGSPGLS
ncbi:uncharacterized protein N7511_009556 [Penicillium nucicola]|uniref:uncharacterized protein n=1 Tax=Penicillium nucicola TaxID=1850975 RepID=UPI0025450581|nr:uncharacterized protein N7511_009556 [Penicillium nucicola]KAJ5747860.1 hypothetical protein N7511_009556 [Penicillium nucicola]